MAATRGRGPTLAKDMNRKLIYGEIKRLGHCTRTELASALRLNKNTVNAIVDELMAAGYVAPTGPKRGRGAGRKALEIAFEPANRKAFGFQLNAGSLVAVVADLYGAPLEQTERRLGSTAPDEVVAAVADFVRPRLESAGHAEYIGAGIGIPAIVDPAGEKVLRSTHLGWKNVALRELLAAAIPIAKERWLVDNGVKLASQGEFWYGAGQGIDQFAYCSFGAGVGCSLVVGGTIVRGADGLAGELGHIVVEEGGPPCACGNAGCLEAVAGLPSILERLSKSSGAKVQDAEAFAVLAEAGVPAALAELERVGRAIGVALACLVNLFNPQRIVCDGPLMAASRLLFPIVLHTMRERTLGPALARTELVRSGLNPLAAAVGAAAGVVRAWEQQADPLEPILF